MGRILLRSLGPVWPLGLLALAGAGVLRALGWPAEAFIAALAAATLALLATPITLLPGARILAELRRADPGRAPGGSLWPGLSWALRVPPAPVAVAVPAGNSESVAQMNAAVRAVASEIALLKRQGTEMRRSFTEAVEAGHRMATAAETAGLWFDDTARRSTEAAASLGQLQAMAAAQANSLDVLTDQAGQALALLGDAAPGKAWLEAVMARAPELPEQLDAVLQRVEAGAAALADAEALPGRLADQVSALELAGERLRMLAGELPEQVASLGAVVQQFDGVAGLPGRFDAVLARSEDQAATQLDAMASLPERFEAAFAQAEAWGAGLAVRIEAMAELPERVDAAFARAETQVMQQTAVTAAQLEAMARLPDRFDATLAQAEAQLAMLHETAEQLAGTPQRLDAAMTRADEHATGLAEVAAHCAAMTGLPERLDAAFARAEGQVAGLTAVARQLDTMVELPKRFDAALERFATVADADQGRLQQGLAGLAGSDARLQAATAALEATSARLGEALPQAVAQRLDGIAAPMHRAIAGLTEVGEALAPVAAGMAGLVQQIPRLEAAIDRAAEAPRHTAEQLAAVTGAIEAMVRQARPEPVEARPSAGRSVSARILGQLDAEAEPAVTATLLRLDGVETEVEQLLRRAEHLVEGPGGMAPVSPGLARHAPELLEGLDATIRQLQSVATAIAVAADRGSRRALARA